jgi:hypothetical protein
MIVAFGKPSSGANAPSSCKIGEFLWKKTITNWRVMVRPTKSLSNQNTDDESDAILHEKKESSFSS